MKGITSVPVIFIVNNSCIFTISGDSYDFTASIPIPAPTITTT